MTPGIMAAPEPPVLAAEGLIKSFGRRHVLRDVSFSVDQGTLVGIVGENGAGKSTLLKILAGELRPDAGLLNRRGSSGYCPQAPTLNEALTVAQHLDYFAAAYGLDDLSYADELVGRLAYHEYRPERIAALSGGTQQKLNLTLALMHRPAVLLLDEPYQGFDWETYMHFWELVGELRAEGRAVVVISHLIFEQSRFDHIFRLHAGRLERDAQ